MLQLKNSAKQHVSKGSQLRQPELEEPKKISAGTGKFTSLFALLICVNLFVCGVFFIQVMGVRVDEEGYPKVEIATMRYGKGWVAKGR